MFVCKIVFTDLTGLALLKVEHVEEEAKFTRQTKLFVAEMVEEGSTKRFDEIQQLKRS